MTKFSLAGMLVIGAVAVGAIMMVLMLRRVTLRLTLAIAASQLPVIKGGELVKGGGAHVREIILNDHLVQR